MPKLTPFKQMSKAEQAEYLRSLPRAPALPRKRSTTATVTASAPPEEPRRKAEAEPRDGLAWLLKKKRIDKALAREGMLYRAGFREDHGGVEGVKSCLDVVGVDGGGEGRELALVAMSDARRDYLLIVGQVLWHDPQLVAVMDGVCGHGYTLRFLAGGDKHRAAELEIMLKVALGLVAAWRLRHKRRLLTNGAETPQQSDIPQSCARTEA